MFKGIWLIRCGIVCAFKTFSVKNIKKQIGLLLKNDFEAIKFKSTIKIFIGRHNRNKD